MAISGRLVATASRITPPSAVPRCSRVERTSVWFDSAMPAIQTAAAAATKISEVAHRGSDSTDLHSDVDVVQTRHHPSQARRPRWRCHSSTTVAPPRGDPTGRPRSLDFPPPAPVTELAASRTGSSLSPGVPGALMCREAPRRRHGPGGSRCGQPADRGPALDPRAPARGAPCIAARVVMTAQAHTTPGTGPTTPRGPLRRGPEVAMTPRPCSAGCGWCPEDVCCAGGVRSVVGRAGGAHEAGRQIPGRETAAVWRRHLHLRRALDPRLHR